MSRTPRVLFAVVLPAHMQHSGAWNAAVSLAEALATTKEVVVDVAHLAEAATIETRDGVRYLGRTPRGVLARLGARAPRAMHSVLSHSDLNHVVEFGQYDVIHVHNMLPARELRRVVAAARRAGVPFVVTTHGLVELADPTVAYHLTSKVSRLAWDAVVMSAVRATLRVADSVCALSTFDADLAVSLGCPESRITIVPNGVGPAFLQEADAARIDALRRRYGFADTPAPVFLYVGNHTANKGIDVLIEAFGRVRSPHTLVIAGEQRSGVDYRAVEDEGRNATVLTGSVDQADLAALYQAADVFVFPTRADTLPLVVLEAMASGTPVLSTRVGGIPFQLEGGCGLIVAPGDPEALALAADDLIEDSEARRAMAVAARERVLAEFRWEAAADKTLAVYERVRSTGKPERS